MNFRFQIVALSTLAATVSLSAATFSDLSMRQRWPWSQKVDISYTLDSDAPVCVSLALYSGTNKLAVSSSALSGDLWNVAPGGVRTITFDPSKTIYTNRVLSNIRARLTAMEQPLYMIVDLTKSMADPKQITYVSAYDLTNSASAYGSWEYCSVKTNGVAVQDAIIWTGVTNDIRYATSNLVLRYLPEGTFMMGSTAAEIGYNSNEANQHQVTLKKAFFAGVFELTVAQYSLVKNLAANVNTHPQASIKYDEIRGCSTNETDAISWPLTGSRVGKGTFLALLRDKTGVDFDLPTEAQWEYACRAGTTLGYWNDGSAILSSGTDANLANVGWYKATSGNSAQPVGRLHPNAWGLYDMHGNVWEWCLDWFLGSYPLLARSEDRGYSGPDTGNGRCTRGGSKGDDTAARCRSACRNTVDPSGYAGTGFGFRVFVTLP